jgi:hypothetical protein
MSVNWIDVEDVLISPPEGVAVKLEVSPSRIGVRFKPKEDLIKSTPKTPQNISDKK